MQAARDLNGASSKCRKLESINLYCLGERGERAGEGAAAGAAQGGGQAGGGEDTAQDGQQEPVFVKHSSTPSWPGYICPKHKFQLNVTRQTMHF